MKKILLCLSLLFSIFLLSSCGTAKSDDIINPDADFVYYYGKTCPHCIALDKELKQKDIYSKNILEKKEVWSNFKNQDEFTALTNSLGLPREEVGVPFMYVKSTKKHYIGQSNIVPVLEQAIAQMIVVSPEVVPSKEAK